MTAGLSMITRTEILMDTMVTIQVACSSGAENALERAFGWFREIEARCSRFDQQSELMQLIACFGVAVPASAILFEAVQFSLRLAEETGGAFDPTIGLNMEERGFNREYRTGKLIRTPIAHVAAVSYRDVQLDANRRTILLRRPLVFDLGAVAKGLAVDMAARELQAFGNFAIDAGGDVYLGGCNPQGEPWSVGIRHPRLVGVWMDAFRVSDQAVCTSGDYARRHHILDTRTGEPAGAVASATVIAPNAMLADGLATAAFVLGPVHGIELLDRVGVEGLIVTPDLKRYETRGLRRAA